MFPPPAPALTSQAGCKGRCLRGVNQVGQRPRIAISSPMLKPAYHPASQAGERARLAATFDVAEIAQNDAVARSSRQLKMRRVAGAFFRIVNPQKRFRPALTRRTSKERKVSEQGP